MAHQPGLEVLVPPSDPEIISKNHSTSRNTYTDLAPEVVPVELLHHQSHRPEAILARKDHEKVSAIVTSEESSYALGNPAPGYSKYLHGRHRRLLTLSGIGIFILIIVAAVVGGVVGSKRNDTSSVSPIATPGTPTSSASLPKSTVTPPRPLQSNSGLAVAGWRTQDEFFNLRIFYQDQDDGLKFSEYKSDGAGWGGTTKVDREDILSNTTLGATVILEMNPPQYELFFLNTSSLVTGNNFRDRVTKITGDVDSIDGYPILAHSKSRLSTFWPYVALQKPNETLHIVNWVGIDPTAWQNQTLGIDALEGSSLAILPLSSSYQAPYHTALVYRRPDGVLSLHSLEYGSAGSELLTVDIGGSYPSSFGSFAVARENDPNNGTNIYILYQTESNDLEYVYYRGDSWKRGPSSDVLKNADPGTDITCLTESIWDGLAVMSPKYDMSRCFFYSGGRIKQVHFNGTGWTEAETVPYP
ncbi:hypothetical protein F5Y08DRAFT_303804 [Xylaria arbuscula]|nr:hypothetical protein F5Y08DRAFT_303804 [Xylaria arbuscula]